MINGIKKSECVKFETDSLSIFNQYVIYCLSFFYVAMSKKTHLDKMEIQRSYTFLLKSQNAVKRHSSYCVIHCSDIGNASVGNKSVCTFILSVLDFFLQGQIKNDIRFIS